MFKFVALSTLLAVASAGDLLAAAPALAYSSAPAVSHVSYASPALSYAAAAPIVKAGPALSYAAAVGPVAIHAPAVGSSHESTYRSLDGNSAVSHYSKSVDTAFSSVRKYDTRVTNDAKYIAPAYSYAAAAAPIVKAAPVFSYAAAPIVKAQPVLSYGAAAAPVHYAAAAPVHYAAAAPVHYAAAAAAPIHYAAGPAHITSHTTFSGLGATYAF